MHLPLAIAVDRDIELGGDLLFQGSAVQALLKRGDRGGYLLGALALLSRRPIQTAQAVEHSAFDLVLRIGCQLDVARWVEAIDRRDKADDAGGHQIVQAYGLGQASVNSASELADLGQMLQNQGLALFIGQGLSVRTWIVQYVLLTSIGRFRNNYGGVRHNAIC
jgi:hypothetical protein